MTSFDTSRAIIEISGEERVHFLQGIVTQDVAQLSESKLLFAALLSPQGKLVHDFFLLARGDTILLDVAAAHKETLIKRLTMYKLRAKVALRDVSESQHVAYVTSGGLADPRHANLPQRAYQPVNESLTTDEYHRQRIALGIPDGALDVIDDVAMDLGYDLLNAISFTKGCYVGQEVTARMHHKQIARRGFYMVEGDALAALGTEVKADELKVGTMRGALGNKGLALLKFGEVAHANANNIPLTVGNQKVTATAPAWMSPKLALFHAAHENQ